MARRSPVEVDARRLALRDLLATRKYRGDKDAVELLASSAADLAQEAAYELNAGRVPEARRYARAHQLIAESRRRLVARHQREIDAQREREAAEHGIRAGETVRVVSLRPAGDVPVGTVVTVGRVSGSALFVDHDGKSSLVWGRDVERVEPEPAGVVITREKVRPVRVLPGARYLRDGEGLYHWTYNYTVDGGPLCQYGPGLQSLMDMLKRRQPGATIVKSWAVTQ